MGRGGHAMLLLMLMHARPPCAPHMRVRKVGVHASVCVGGGRGRAALAREYARSPTPRALLLIGCGRRWCGLLEWRRARCEVAAAIAHAALPELRGELQGLHFKAGSDAVMFLKT